MQGGRGTGNHLDYGSGVQFITLHYNLQLTITYGSYSGEKKQTWTFKMYITFHQKGHLAKSGLEDYCKPVPLLKQVQDLLHKIKIVCTNRMMGASKATLHALNNRHIDFQDAPAYSGYYGCFCNFVAENKKDHSTWTISGVGVK